MSLRGTLKLGEPMASHVSWRAGGKVARTYAPADLADLAGFLAQTRIDEPILFVGLGSNLLVRDGGFDGTVVLSYGGLNQLESQGDGRIYAQAGVASPQLARFAAQQGTTGLEFLAGIPGTVGGALAMNAGCHGGETWQFVDQVQTIDRAGQLHVRSPEEFAVDYRHVGLKQVTDEWFVGAWFRVPAGDAEQSKQQIRQWLEKRAATQPLQLPNAGSVFRNPANDHAGRLIEAAGLKGYRIGGAEVSEKHANFIVNPGGKATAGNIEDLIIHVQNTVLAQSGIKLQREVRIVGIRDE